MPNRRKPTAERAKGEPFTMSMRLAPELAEALEALLAEENASGVWPKRTMSSLIRELLSEGVERRQRRQR